MEAGPRLIGNCIDLLEQATGVIERIDADVYASTTAISPRGSIGMHLRHVLDFYDSFLCGIESGQIDSNARRRDPLIERDRLYALNRIAATIGKLRSFSPAHYSAAVQVSSEDDGENDRVWCASSVLRELEFLQSHTIHHYSLIAMLLRLHEIDPGDRFGVAASTLAHWKEEAACAQ